MFGRFTKGGGGAHWEWLGRYLDEDEFEAHRALLGYPPEVISLAVQTSRDVLDAVGAGREPFATGGFERLRQVTSPE